MSATARRAGFYGDRRGLAVIATVLAALVALALFFVSFEGLSYVGHLLGLGGGAWIVPVALDAGIVVATLLAIIRRAQKRRAGLEWAIVYTSTAASAAANFASHAQRDQGLLPALVAASAPVLLLLLSHSIIRTLVVNEEPVPRRRNAPAVAATPTPVSETPVTTSAPRPTRAPAARKPAGDRRVTVAYPFGEVERLETDELLNDFDRLTHLLTVDKTVRNADPEAPRLVAIIHTLNARGVPIKNLRERAGLENEVLLRALLRTGKTNATKIEQSVAA